VAARVGKRFHTEGKGCKGACFAVRKVHSPVCEENFFDGVGSLSLLYPHLQTKRPKPLTVTVTVTHTVKASALDRFWHRSHGTPTAEYGKATQSTKKVVARQRAELVVLVRVSSEQCNPSHMRSTNIGT
jgi:hypothetical protein